MLLKITLRVFLNILHITITCLYEVFQCNLIQIIPFIVLMMSYERHWKEDNNTIFRMYMQKCIKNYEQLLKQNRATSRSSETDGSHN